MEEIKRKKICSLCGKSYEYKCRVDYLPNGKKECYHDGEFQSDTLKFSQHEKKLAEKYHKQGKVLVKGDDGLTRVCDVARDARGKIIRRKK